MSDPLPVEPRLDLLEARIARLALRLSRLEGDKEPTPSGGVVPAVGPSHLVPDGAHYLQRVESLGNYPRGGDTVSDYRLRLTFQTPGSKAVDAYHIEIPFRRGLSVRETMDCVDEIQRELHKFQKMLDDHETRVLPLSPP